MHWCYYFQTEVLGPCTFSPGDISRKESACQCWKHRSHRFFFFNHDYADIFYFSVCSVELSFESLLWFYFFYFFPFFFSFIFISWRPITLQYCSGFCHTLTWISHGFTCIPHPDPPPPTSLSTQSLWVFPVHQARALVSCIQPGLVICFTLDNIHVSMLVSWNIPPLPSPTESKCLFCTSVSLFLFCI